MRQAIINPWKEYKTTDAMQTISFNVIICVFSTTEQIRRSHSEKGGDRLQNLISKNRGYSEPGATHERKIKPLSVPSSKMGLVTKGRSFGPAAPKSDKEVSEEEIKCAESRVQESHSPLTSSHTSDAYTKRSSPCFLAKESEQNGVILNDFEALLQDDVSPLQENKDSKVISVGEETVDVGAQCDGEALGVQQVDEEKRGTEEGRDEDKDDNEAEEDETDSDSEEEDDDNEQQDIDNLIDR